MSIQCHNSIFHWSTGILSQLGWFCGIKCIKWIKSISIQKLSSVVCSHCPTLGQTQISINLHRTQSECVLMSVSVHYEHHTILYNPILLFSVFVSISGNVNTLWSRSQRSYFSKLILHASEAAWSPIHSILPDGESSATTTCVICHHVWDPLNRN